MPITKIDCWQTSDGKTFFIEQNAKDYEQRLSLANYIRSECCIDEEQALEIAELLCLRPGPWLAVPRPLK